MALPLGASCNACARNGAVCGLGLQCTPRTASAFTCNGICVECQLGQQCPAGTGNYQAIAARVACREGFSCPQPAVREECAAGFFCPAGTFNGGIACPTRIGGRANQVFGFCPPQTSELSRSNLCPAGHRCTNASTAIPCDAGESCPEGTNQSLPCFDDAIGGSAIERCPPQTRVEPPFLGGTMAAVGVTLVVLLLLEILARFFECKRPAQEPTARKKMPQRGRRISSTGGQPSDSAYVEQRRRSLASRSGKRPDGLRFRHRWHGARRV